MSDKSKPGPIRSLLNILVKRDRGGRAWEDLSRDEKLAKAREADTKDYQYIERVAGVPIYKFYDYESYLTAGTKRIWATFRACHITACVVVSTDFKLMHAKKDETTDLESFYPDLAKLLKEPNEFDSWEEMVYQWTFQLKLCGNVYWLKDEIDARGRPTHVYPLLPQYIIPVPDRKKRIAHYEYRVNGHSIIMQPEEIMHFRRQNPRDNILGLGDMEAGEPLFEDFINRDIYQEAFMKNGAQPSGVLMRDEPVEDEGTWKKMVASIREKYEGKKNVGRTMMLSGKWSYQQLGFSLQEMQAVEKEEASLKHIFLAHGVPLSVAGFGAANYATSRQDDINFRKYECVPLLDTFCGKLNRVDGMVKPYDPLLELDYNLSGLIDIEQVKKDYSDLVGLGALTPNQLRELCGLAKVDDPMLDQYYLNNTLVPMEMAGLSNPSQTDIQKISQALRVRS